MLGSVLALGPTTVVSSGDAISVPPANKIAVQVKGGVGTLRIDGSLNGVNYVTLIANTTFSTAGRLFTSTGNFLVTKIKPVLVAHTASTKTSVWLTAALL